MNKQNNSKNSHNVVISIFITAIILLNILFSHNGHNMHINQSQSFLSAGLILEQKPKNILDISPGETQRVNGAVLKDSIYVNVKNIHGDPRFPRQENIYSLQTFDPLFDDIVFVSSVNIKIHTSEHTPYAMPIGVPSTQVKVQGYMQRTITLLILTGVLEQWRSTLDTSELIKGMYRRMKQDPRLIVEEKQVQYAPGRWRPQFIIAKNPAFMLYDKTILSCA